MSEVVSCAPLAPYSLERTVGQFARFPGELVDRVDSDSYRRLFLRGDRLDLLEARSAISDDLSSSVLISLLNTDKTPPHAPDTSTMERILSIYEPIEHVYQAVEGWAVLEYLTRTLRGLRRTIDPTPFEGLVHSILAQLISIQGAAVVRSRFVREFGTSTVYDGIDYWAFPEPASVREATVDHLCQLGMTGAKARAILGVAELAHRGELERAQLERASDADVIRHLTELPGIGPWTAEWFLINVLGRMSIVPAGDLGVRRVTGKWLLDGTMPDPADVRRAYEPFGEVAGYVAYYVLSAERYALDFPVAD